jgi:hypothetical protein
LLWRYRHQVARLLCNSGVTFGEPLGVSIVVELMSAGLPASFVRSLDLPSASSSSNSGRLASLQLRRHPCHVARPSSGSAVIFVRSLDLPPALLSSSSGHSTFLRLRRRPRQVARPPYGSVVAFASSEDLPRILCRNESLPEGCAPKWPCQVLPDAWVL